MSVIICPECGFPNQENHKICPECGFPFGNPKNKLKINPKIIIFLLIIVVVAASAFKFTEHQKNEFQTQLVKGSSWQIKNTESKIAFNDKGRVIYSDINFYGITNGMDAQLISGNYKIISKNTIKIGDQKVTVTIESKEIYFEPDIKAVLLEAIKEEEN